MIISNIRIKGMKVSKYTKDFTVFDVMFDDGDERVLKKSINLSKSEEAVDSVFFDLRQLQKNATTKMAKFDTEDPMGRTLMIRFENEGQAREKMRQFIEKVNDRAVSMITNKDASGYLNRITEINRMESRF